MKLVSTEKISYLAIPGLVFLSLIYALPLFLLLVKSFVGENGGASLNAYIEFLSDPYNHTVLWRTLRVALLTTLLALFIGYPTALVLARVKGKMQAFLLMCMVLPLSVGVIVKAFAWSILFRSNGMLNQSLIAVGIIDKPVRMLFTETALIIGASNVFLPFMVLPIYSVLRQIDGSLFDVASSLGASAYFRIFKVLLPLSVPGVIAGSAFTFSLAVSMYVIPSLIVGERQQTVSMLIARSFLYIRDEPAGAAMSAILLFIAITVLLLSNWAARRAAGVRA